MAQQSLQPGSVAGLDMHAGIPGKIRRVRILEQAPRDGGESHGRDEQEPPPLLHCAMSLASSWSKSPRIENQRRRRWRSRARSPWISAWVSTACRN